MQRERDYADNAVKRGLTHFLFLDSKEKLKFITCEIKVSSLTHILFLDSKEKEIKLNKDVV